MIRTANVPKEAALAAEHSAEPRTVPQTAVLRLLLGILSKNSVSELKKAFSNA